MSVRATYRVQLNRGFTFADAEAIVPYLADLGISHLYVSPITTAQPGSTHGYDVIDPTAVNAELGGEAGLRRLGAVLRRHALGLIIDIVPNHMGIAGGTNPWWQDVLAKGQASPYARFFDIDWRERLLLPFLGDSVGETIARGDLALRYNPAAGCLAVVAYDHTPYPIRREDHAEVLASGPETYTGDRLGALLDRQHYRLAWWRTANDELNWRRFFTVNELAGLRQEDPAVFEATHALIFRLRAEGLIDGVRVDHVDGLTDPADYCRRLRARLGPDAFIIVEKILASRERFPLDWGVDGTTGYDFMEEVSALLHAPIGELALTRFWVELTGRQPDFALEALKARQEMLAWEFEGQFSTCVRAFRLLAASAPATRELTEGMLRRSLRAMLWVFPVYRTYGDGTNASEPDAAVLSEAGRRAGAYVAPGEKSVADAVIAWLAGAGPGDSQLAAEAVRCFQQLTAPLAAKAVEDTALYRYGRLLSRNEVGADPTALSISADSFHARMTSRARDWPRTMITTATHDHKRGEHVRARLAVLSEVSGEWVGWTDAWIDRFGGWEIMRDDVYKLMQTLVGGWPTGLDSGDPEGLRGFADRVAEWQHKALREAKLMSSWAEPNDVYEAQTDALLTHLLDPAISSDWIAEIAAFVRRIAPAAEANALVQAFLRCTCPGVPDLYQGCEYADLSLVDPDNRRPVDYEVRRATICDGSTGFDARKQALIATLLRLRREHPDLFVGASYEPVSAAGKRGDPAEHVIAFVRRSGDKALLAAAAIHCAEPLVGTGLATPPAEWWGDTALVVPDDLAGRDAANPLAALEGADAPGLSVGMPVRLGSTQSLGADATQRPCCAGHQHQVRPAPSQSR